jgi:hypothetical protein
VQRCSAAPPSQTFKRGNEMSQPSDYPEVKTRLRRAEYRVKLLEKKLDLLLSALLDFAGDTYSYAKSGSLKEKRAETLRDAIRAADEAEVD